MKLEHSMVSKPLVEKLQLLLDQRFGVRVPIVVSDDKRPRLQAPSLWVQLRASPDPDGGIAVDETLELVGFVSPTDGRELSIKFSFSQHGPSSQIDQWDVEIVGGVSDERAVFWQLFDPTPWQWVPGWGGWGRNLKPTFRFNGDETLYKA